MISAYVGRLEIGKGPIIDLCTKKGGVKKQCSGNGKVQAKAEGPEPCLVLSQLPTCIVVHQEHVMEATSFLHASWMPWPVESSTAVIGIQDSKSFREFERFRMAAKVIISQSFNIYEQSTDQEICL